MGRALPGELYRARYQLRSTLDKCPKEYKLARRSIGKKLQSVREKINRIPVIASKYQIIFKGAAAFFSFLRWAVGAGWNANNRPTSRWLEMFDLRLNARRQRRALNRMRWSDTEWAQAIGDYGNYQLFDQSEHPADDWAGYSLEYCQ